MLSKTTTWALHEHCRCQVLPTAPDTEEQPPTPQLGWSRASSGGSELSQEQGMKPEHRTEILFNSRMAQVIVVLCEHQTKLLWR